MLSVLLLLFRPVKTPLRLLHNANNGAHTNAVGLLEFLRADSTSAK